MYHAPRHPRRRGPAPSDFGLRISNSGLPITRGALPIRERRRAGISALLPAAPLLLAALLGACGPVAADNLPPALDPIADQSVAWGTPLAFSAVAHDGDTPANTLTFSLVGPPAGASINAATGAFTWTPTSAQIGTASFTVRVTDNGSPPLSAEQRANVAVGKRATTVVYSGGPAVHYSDRPQFSAALRDNGGGTLQEARIPNARITFAGGVQSVAAFTDANGVATVATPPKVSQRPGSTVFRAQFAGSARYLDAVSSGGCEIQKESAALSYTGVTLAPALGSNTLALSATFTQQEDGEPGLNALAGCVRFDVKRANDGVTVCSKAGVVGSNGTAAGTTASLPNVAYTVTVSLISSFYTATPVNGNVVARLGVTSVTPNWGTSYCDVDAALQIIGEGFVKGAPISSTCALETPGHVALPSRVTVVSDTRIDAEIGLWGCAAGDWAVAVLNPDGQEASVPFAVVDPTLAITGVSMPEGNASIREMNFTVTLSAPTTRAVTVDWATADGTATAGSDYTAASGTLTFAPLETRKTITVRETADMVDEPDETFTVTLSNPVGSILAPAQATGTIVDDEATPTLSIDDVTHAEGNTANTLFLFTVTLSGRSGSTVTASFAITDGTATVAGNDYLDSGGRLTFAPGETSKTISVAVRTDTVSEPTETFTVDLSNPTNATLADAQGLGTITDDDSKRAARVHGR